KGRARLTAIDQDGRTFQDDVGEGDLWYFPAGIPHSIQGIEGDGCEFLLMFDDGNFSEEETFLLTDWLAPTRRGVLEGVMKGNALVFLLAGILSGCATYRAQPLSTWSTLPDRIPDLTIDPRPD